MSDARKEVLATLNKHFRTAVLEKYPEAMIQTYIDRAWDAVCGPTYKKQRVSEKDRQRIKDHILKELQTNYGKWISIINFDKRFRFSTNFEYVYKTDFGRLYANPPRSGFGHLFFTSHSLQQFDDRVSIEKLKDYRLVYKKAFGSYPTAADILIFFVMFCFQFGIKDNFIFLNVNYGILVIEMLSKECFIVKTFLSPEMVDADVRWYVLKPEHNSMYSDMHILIKEADTYANQVETPIFDLPEFDYDFFNTVLMRKL
jgi:hypothetical protein